jgi:hypothetical protein
MHITRCASAGILVYSPHTACDCAKEGMNDWLAKGYPGSVAVISPSRVEGMCLFVWCVCLCVFMYVCTYTCIYIQI